MAQGNGDIREEDKPETRPPAAGKRGLLAAAALAAFLIFALHGHLWLSGHTVFRAAIQEQYYLIGQYAFDHKIVADFAAGGFPLWNHLNGLGAPLLGNMLSAAFYPLKAIVYLGRTPAAYDLYIVIRLLAAALFSYALCRRLKLGPVPSLLGCVCFAFTGYMKMFVNENYLNADVLLPAACLLALRLSSKRRLPDLLLLALVVFAVLNNGHPEAAFYTILLPAWLALAVPSGLRGKAGSALVFCAAVSAGVMLSLPLLLAFVEYWWRGFHFHAPGAGFFHFSASEASALVSPWFFGQAPAGAPFSRPPELVWTEGLSGLPGYAETAAPWLAPSLGAVPLFMAVMAGSCGRRLTRVEASLSIYALFFLGVVFGLPLFRLVGYLPVFGFSGNFKHPLPGVALCVAVLAARGLQWIMEGKISRARIGNVTLYFFIAVLILCAVQQHYSPADGPFNPYSITTLAVLAATGAWLFITAGWEGASSGAGVAALMKGLAVLAAACALLVMDGFQQPGRDPGYEERLSGPAMDRLMELVDPERAYISQDISPPNMNLVFGIPDIRVMDGINDRRLVRAINAINGHTRAQGGQYWYRATGYLQPMPDKTGHPLARLFSVKYALMDGPMPYNRTIGEVLSRAKITAPGPGYVGRATLPLPEGLAPGLLQHPPSKVVWAPFGEDKNETLPPSLRVKLAPSVGKEAAGLQKDGVWLVFSDGTVLAYARYLHPGARAGEAPPPPVEMTAECGVLPSPCRRLIFSSLPGESAEYDQAGWADLRAGTDKEFDKGTWEDVFARDNWLYRNPEALPRAFAVGGAEAVTEDLALELLAGGEVDPRNTALVSGRGAEDYASLAGGGEGAPGFVNGLYYSPQRIQIEARMQRPGFLVVTDLYYPGWVCRVDGEPVRIMRTDYCLRGVPLGAGEHRVEFVYVPVSFRTGLFAALGCLIFSSAVLLRSRGRHISYEARAGSR